MKYIAVIADIINSRELHNRKSIQNKLEQTLKALNRNNSSIISPYTITIGDEFQALYINAKNLFHDILQIIIELNPVKIRFSIAVGLISTDINRQSAIGMDGLVFYIARENIIKLKKRNSLIRICGLPEANEKFINLTLEIISNQMAVWKLNRWKILQFMLGGNKQFEEISKSLSISERAVYKNVSTGSLDVINALLLEITSLIDREVRK